MENNEKFGTDKNPSGMMAMWGGRPGILKPFTNAPFTRFDNYLLEFTTTEEAIDQLLPYPLKRAKDLPPTVMCVYLNAPLWRGWDGKNKPYDEIGLWVPCEYKGHVGINLFHLYLDGPGASVATIATREQYGATKFIGNIDASVNEDGDELWATVTEYGVPQISMHCQFTEEVTSEDSPLDLTSKILGVKEIPNCNFDGYDVRKVILSDWSYLAGKGHTGAQAPKLTLKKGTGDLQLRGNLAAFPIVEVGPAYNWITIKSNVENFFSGSSVLEDLLK